MLSFISAELDIDFSLTPPDPIGAVREALGAFRIIGLVEDDAEARGGTVSGVLAYVPGQGLLVHTADGAAPTPVQPIIDAIAARLGAHVNFRGGDDEFSSVGASWSEERDDDVSATHPAETVFVVGGTLPLAADRRAEIAHQLQADVVAVPLSADGRTLVVTSRRGPFAYWSRAQRPVIALQRTDDAVEVHVYSTRAVRTGRMRDRLTMAGIPDWMALWDRVPVALSATGTRGGDEPRDVEPNGIEPNGIAAEIESRLLHERRETIRSLALTDEAVLAETRIDGPALAELLGRPLDDRLVADLGAALRLPPEVTAVVSGERRAASLPGAVEIEDRGLKGVMSDTLYAEPEGSSFWTRWRRLPHRHPRAAVALICGELALATAVVWSGAVLDWPHPWLGASWVLAGVLAIDAVGDAFLLTKIRRRARG